ncbi:type III secretion system stator protein SctL [Rhizobium oryzicola]|uniref:Type 3 secretion system stator protein n=1 Tax=Rhizobium oryzicola TaxID=1232668 RepID=A0ABT8SXM4_9HYPH|nr:type III secretion system stator protein SctL [Rhizobium oryzicola]MDO1583183.1 type III secretion system stator protein SctL [Rhizobium oryzicola]
MGPYYRLNTLGFRLPSGPHVIRRDAFEAVAASEALLQEADRRAAEIIAGAEAAFESEKRRGFEEGLRAARREAAARLFSENLILEQKLAAVETELADLVVAAMRCLLEDFDDRTKAEALVRTALRRMRREKRGELRVSPEQATEMKSSITRIISEFPEVDLVDVVEDESLSAPNIVFETAIGRVDGDLGRTCSELEIAIRAAVTGAVGASTEHETGP